MGLYGDKLTKTDGSGIDVLTKSAGTAQDGLTKSDDSGVDILTKSAGTAQDGLTKSSGTPTDNLLQHYKIINEDFEGSAVAGIIAGWEISTGIATIEDPGFTGTKSQRVTDNYYEGGAYIFKSFGFTIDKQYLRLRLSYKASSAVTRFVISQRGSNTVIFSINNPSFLFAQNIDVIFFADGMTGLDFKMESTEDGDYFEIDNVLLEVNQQDNLAYTI